MVSVCRKLIPLVPWETGMEVPGVGKESNDNESDSIIIDTISSESEA